VTPHLRILASAGSGKTYRLSTRYIELLKADVDPGTILATTFTRAAAGEIRDRVIDRLAEAALVEEKAAELKLSTARAAELLAKAIASLHRLRIQTLDSFFTGFVRGFATEFDLPPDLVPVDDAGRAALDEAALVGLLDGLERPADEERLLDTLASIRRGRAGSRLASAIRLSVRETLEIAREGHPAAWEWDVPAIDPAGFRAAVERLRAIAAELDAHVKVVGKDVEAMLAAPGLPDFETAAGALGRGLFKPIRAGQPTYSRTEIPRALADAYRPVIATLEAIVLDGYARQTLGMRDLALDFAEVRERIKRARGIVEFDDLVRAVVKGADDVRLASLFFRLDGRVRHVLLDEFQDTSGIQWKALRPILDEIVADASGQRSLFVVGDLKQSVYGWRGANPEILASLPGRLGLVPGETIRDDRMAESRRSSPDVLAGVNRLFGWISDHADAFGERSGAIGRWCTQFEPHDAAGKAVDGRGVVHLRVADAIEGKRSAAAVRTSVLAATVKLAKELRAAHPGRSLAIIARTNAFAAEVVNRLHREGIAASAFGSGALQDAAAVNAVLDCLVLADHPDHTIACFNVARSPLGAEVTLDREAHRHEVRRRAWSREERARLAREGVAGRIRSLAALARPHADARESLRLDQLVDRAARLEAELDRLPADDPRRRPAAIARALREASVEDLAGDAIEVMTVHQSKGLDFDLTITTELDREVKTRDALAVSRPDPCEPPQAVVRWPAQEICPEAFLPACRETAHRLVMESLSVLYVSLTRAKRGLFAVVAAPTDAPAVVPDGPIWLGAILREAWAPDLAAGEARDVFGSLADITFEKPVEAVDDAPAPAIERPRGPIRFAPAKGLRPIRARPASAHAESTEDALSFDRSAADRGTALHAAFELIRWSDDPAPGDAAIAAAIRAELPRAEPAWIAERIAEFRRAAASPVVRRALARPDGPATVRREHPFVRRREDGLQFGFIDRLVLHGDPAMPHAAEIVDFKSDAVSPSEAESHARERHRGQLHSYRTAVAERFRIHADDIRLTVILIAPSRGEPVAVDLSGA
jgi:ATP-dependent exoDNAse (exonuclease V) beta subunit